MKMTKLKEPSPPDDTVTKLIGHFGKWQFTVFSMVFLIKVSSAWIQMAILFLTPPSSFICVEFLPNSSLSKLPYHRVNISTCYEECVKYEHDTSPYTNTIVSEWDLVCERRWMASFTQTLLQFGVLVGSIIFGFLSDRFGRKNTFLSSVAIILIIGFAIPFSPDYWTFTILRFFLGMATAGTMVVSFVLIVEITSPRYREMLACIYHIPFVFGHMCIPLFAYLFPSWNSYSLALVVPQLVYLMYFVYLPESPRWLASVGRVDEATAIVRHAAEMNQRPTDDVDVSMAKFSADLMSRSKESRLNYSHLFHKQLFVRTLATLFLWLSTGLMFFGFNQYVSQTSSSPYISTALAAGIQVPSVFSTIWLIKRFGRRPVVAICFMLAGACVISLGFVPKVYWLTTTISTVGVLFSSYVATTVYIYTSELYPTVVRNMGLGASSMSMRIGTMIAPFVSNLSIVWLPPIVIGVSQLCAGLVCLLLPETKGKALPDSMDDLTSHDKDNS